MGRITRLFNFNDAPPSDSLVAAWNLENANDNFGANNLTNNGGVTFTTGKINNAGTFDGVDDYLSLADNAALSFGNLELASFVGWFKLTAYPGAGTLAGVISKWDVNVAGRLEYRISISEIGVFEFRVSHDGSASQFVNGADIIQLNTWYFFCCWYDGANLFVELNNSNNIIFTPYASGIFDSISEFRIGAGRVGASQFLLTGQIDAIRIYKRVIHATERSALYNNGVGRQYQSSNIISSDEVNRELSQIIDLLTGITQDISLVIGEATVGFSGSSLVVNQDGLGPIFQCYQSEVLKLEVNNSGQLKSYVATGAAPIIISTTALNTNLNVDLLDGIEASAILQINSYIPLVDSVFYAGTPSVGDRRIINQQGNRLIAIKTQQNGTASSDASTIIAVKKDNSTEDVITSITITGNTQSVITLDITDIDLTVDRIIFEITAISGVTKHSGITVSTITRALPV